MSQPQRHSSIISWSMPFSLQLIVTVVYCLISLVISANNSKTELIIYKFTASGDTSSSKTVEMAEEAAIDEINANSDILSDYVLKLVVLDAKDDEETALVNAINVSQSYSECSLNQTALISPIVMGPPWSSHSVLTSRVFGIYHLVQISESATSPALSDKKKYASFFRTIGNDNLQGMAVIQLCKQMNWTRIGVVHQNDDYGQDFNKVIQSLAEQYNVKMQKESASEECNKCIDVHPWTFFRKDIESIRKAAKYIKDQKLYVTILIAQGVDVYTLLSEGDFDYPYFFVGTDAWFSAGEIMEDNLINFANKYVGTMPGNPLMFDEIEYVKNNIYNGNLTIYNVAKTKYDGVIGKIKEAMRDSEINQNLINHNFMGYAYDAIYAAAYCLDMYDGINSLKQQLKYCHLEKIFNDLRDILNNNISFIGATGPVGFSDGERMDAMFIYGRVNINDNNDVTITKLGHFANGEAVINTKVITYPANEYDDKTVVSMPVISHITMRVSFDTIGIVGGIYSFIVFMAFILCFVRRNNKGKIEYLSMTIGLILNGSLMISYGLQKNGTKISSTYIDHKYHIWCLSIPVVVCLSFTFTFSAFITSKSELMRIVIKFMKKQKLGQYKGDENVSNKVWKCLIADITIISIWMSAYFVVYIEVDGVNLLQYEYIKIGDIESTTDDMAKTQNFYAVCSSHWSTNIFYCILLIYKIGQMLYAIDNNIGGMISYIILVVCMFCIGLIAASWYTLDQMLINGEIKQDIQYLILSFVIIFVYLLWIIPEYYYLCKRVKKRLCIKNATSSSDEPSPPQTTTTPNKSSETSSNTNGDGESSGYPHLTAEEEEKQIMETMNTENNEEEQESDQDIAKIPISKMGISVPSDSAHEVSPKKMDILEMMSINEEKTLSVDGHDNND